MIKMFLDDERCPVDDSWIVVRSVDEAIEFVEQNGIPNYISFDHDLGPGRNGYFFAFWLYTQIMDETFSLPNDFDYYIHSQNPVGAQNIRNVLDKFEIKQNRK